VKKDDILEFEQPDFLKPFSHRSILCFHEDASGVIWVGTEHGILRIQGRETFQISKSDGLFSERIHQILEDDNDWLWISCPRGIYRVPRVDLNRLASGQSQSVYSIVYGMAEGMMIPGTLGGHQSAGCRTPDGRLWFPSRQGVVVIDPKKVPIPQHEPRLVIKELKVNGDINFKWNLKRRQERLTEAVRSSEPHLSADYGSINLKPGQGRLIQISYSANVFHRTSLVQYKYRMDKDHDWIEAGSRREAVFTDLPSVNHTFYLRAVNGYGIQSGRNTTLHIYLKPYFYKTGVFHSALGLMLVFLIWWIHRKRVFQRVQLERLEGSASMERERARIARDMHDDIGSSLSNIALLSDVVQSHPEDPNFVRDRMKGISTMARDVVDDISELVWGNNPRYDTLPDMVAYLREYAAELFSIGSIRCELNFEGSVPSIRVFGSLRRNVFLTFKEALNNILKHADCSFVEIFLNVESELLRLTISDNGRGGGGEPNPLSNGLRNMRKRIEEEGGEFEVESNSGHGTRIRIRLPLTVKPVT
jgi:signal transduction histidine kinase